MVVVETGSFNWDGELEVKKNDSEDSLKVKGWKCWQGADLVFLKDRSFLHRF